MLTVVLVVGAVFCAAQAILANRMLIAALWLAGLSALVAITIYVLGAPQVAVVELSVGAGLVTVLFVFAISVAGDEPMKMSMVIPGTLAWSLILLVVVLLGWTFLTTSGNAAPTAEQSFTNVFWQQRQLDILVQIVLIFVGVLGVLGLLASAMFPATRAEAQAAKPEIVRPAVGPQIPDNSPEPVVPVEPAEPVLEKEQA